MTNPIHSNIQTIVMRRVRAIHVMQSPFTTISVAGVIFIAALWGIGREVWVARVFHNMPSWSDFDAVFRFYLAAFMDTRSIVQVLLILAAVAFMALVANLVRASRYVFVQFA